MRITEALQRFGQLFTEKNIPILVSASAALGLMRGPLDWMLPLLLLERSSPELIGIVFALANVDDTIMAFIGGQLADKLGRRPLIVLSTASYIIGCLVLLISHLATGLASMVLLCASVVILFGVTGMSSGPHSALVSESVSSDRLGRAFSLLMLTVSLSRAVGSALIGLMFALNRLVAFSVMLICAVIGFVCHVMLKETLPGEHQHHEQVSLINHMKRSTTNLKDAFRFGFWPIIALIAFVGMAHGTTGNYFSPYMSQRLVLSEVAIGTLYSLMMLLQAATVMVAGWVTDKHGVTSALTIGNVLPAFCLIVFAVAGNTGVAATALLVSGMLASFGSIGQHVAINTLARSDMRATLFGVTTGVFNLMFVIGPMVGGLLYARGQSLPFLVGGLILVLTIIPILRIKAAISSSERKRDALL